MPRVTGFSVNFDQCLAIATEGKIYEQRRVGSKVSWHAVDLEGLAPRVVKDVHFSPDGRILYALASDMTLWQHTPVGGNRYAIQRAWSQVEFVEPTDDAAKG
jgi:hypothetical protein